MLVSMGILNHQYYASLVGMLSRERTHHPNALSRDTFCQLDFPPKINIRKNAWHHLIEVSQKKRVIEYVNNKRLQMFWEKILIVNVVLGENNNF